jgi:hypothetical protein
MGDIAVRTATTAADRDAVTRILVESWGSTTAVAHGTAYDAATLPALLAAAADAARAAGARRFYQRRGMRIAAVNPGADR